MYYHLCSNKLSSQLPFVDCFEKIAKRQDRHRECTQSSYRIDEFQELLQYFKSLRKLFTYKVTNHAMFPEASLKNAASLKTTFFQNKTKETTTYGPSFCRS